MTKTNLDKMGVYDYLADSLLAADFTLRASTQTFFERVYSENFTRKEWSESRGNFYNTQLRALDLAVAEIASAFKVLCTQKRQGLINFKLKDVLELCAEIDLELSAEHGYVYIDSFHNQLEWDIKNYHKHYASNRRAA